MADNNFGLSFSPTDSKQQQTAGSQLDPIQEAIQILSLRRPTTLGASAPVAGGLFGQPSGQPDLSALLQTLMRQFGGQYRVPPLPKTTMDGGMGGPGVGIPPAPAPPVLQNPSFGFSPGPQAGPVDGSAPSQAPFQRPEPNPRMGGRLV